MNKTTETLLARIEKLEAANKLAEEVISKYSLYCECMGNDDAKEALAAIREALAEPVQEHESREDIAAKEMFEGFSKAWAEPVKQEPVAHYKDAPHTIYLQTGCDDPEDCECSFNEWGGTTWCADQIHDTDIPYIRADYAAPVSAEAIRARSEK